MPGFLGLSSFGGGFGCGLTTGGLGFGGGFFSSFCAKAPTERPATIANVNSIFFIDLITLIPLSFKIYASGESGKVRPHCILSKLGAKDELKTPDAVIWLLLFGFKSRPVYKNLQFPQFSYEIVNSASRLYQHLSEVSAIISSWNQHQMHRIGCGRSY